MDDRGRGALTNTCDVVAWLIELDIRPGRLDPFASLTTEMVRASSSEAGTLTYERFIASDGRTAHLYERYADSNAALVHLKRFERDFARRFLTLVVRKRVFVYGRVSPEVTALLAPLRPVYLDYMNGFAR